MKYFRNVNSRNLWSFNEQEEKWDVNYIQIGKAEEAKSGLTQAFSFIKYLISEDLIKLPVAEFVGKIKCYTGISGCRDYHYFKPIKVWYEEIPGTDIIIERRSKKVKIDLLYVSMYDKLNSGLTVSSENFWDLFLLYNEKILCHIDEEDRFNECVERWKYFGYSDEFVEQEDRGIKIKVGCNEIKLSPDRKFFLWQGTNHLHKVYLNTPYTFNNEQDLQVIENNKSKIREALEEVDIIPNFVYNNSYFIRVIFWDKNSKDYFVSDLYGNSHIPTTKQPFIVFPEIFGEKITGYFIKDEIEIRLTNFDSGWFTEFDQYFDNSEYLNILVSTINNKFGKELIKVFKTKDAGIPKTEEERNSGKDKICLCIKE